LTTYHYQISGDAGGGKKATAGDFVFTTAAVSVITCSITAPTGGQTFTGPVTVSAHATSTANVSGIQFLLDRSTLGAEIPTPVTDASITWDTTTATNGGHALACLARDPTGNTAISAAVNVTVSNPILVVVPNVVGQPQAQATTAIQNAQLTVAVTMQSSATVPLGSVISQSPVGGVRVTPGSVVNLVVSSGVVVPNVVGLSQAQATSAIQSAQLSVAVTTQPSTTVAAGLVISQNPAGGTQASGGSVVQIIVSSGAPPTSPTVDTIVFSDGGGTQTTPAFGTSSAGELLVAFIGSDGPASGSQSVIISGAGLTWTQVSRASMQLGMVEIWTATAVNALTNATVTSTQTAAGYNQSLTVVAFTSAGGIGAFAVTGGATGAPAISLTTTKAGSLVYAVGNDWDSAAARSLGPAQVMVHQWVDAGFGDTYWVQAASGAIGSANTLVRLNDTAPTTDRWNFAIVEILLK
jgi:beta-lactam-binding protein with PASTA domain